MVVSSATTFAVSIDGAAADGDDGVPGPARSGGLDGGAHRGVGRLDVHAVPDLGLDAGGPQPGRDPLPARRWRRRRDR